MKRNMWVPNCKPQRKLIKIISAKGPVKLSDGLIKKLSTYYVLTIIRNSQPIDAMRDTIWATFLSASLTQIRNINSISGEQVELNK